MDDAERQLRNARAIGCWYRVKHAVSGSGIVLLGLVLVAWLMSADAHAERDPGPWPWVAAAACWLVGPLLLWQAFRRSPPPRDGN